MAHVSPRKPFGISNDFVKSGSFKDSKIGLKDPIACYGKGKQLGYIEVVM
jgi:hypothetical protein